MAPQAAALALPAAPGIVQMAHLQLGPIINTQVVGVDLDWFHDFSVDFTDNLDLAGLGIYADQRTADVTISGIISGEKSARPWPSTHHLEVELIQILR